MFEHLISTLIVQSIVMPILMVLLLRMPKGMTIRKERVNIFIRWFIIYVVYIITYIIGYML